MANDYPVQIGLSVGTLQSMATLGVPDPQPTPVHYSEYVIRGDGAPIGVGWKQCEWRWAYIEVDEVRALQTYCPGVSAQVYIKTVGRSAGMEVYLSRMVWPQVEPAEVGDCYEDFVIEFWGLTVAAT